MRIITFILFIISSFVTAQKRDIPVIDFPNTSTTINPYVKFLGLKDENALILKASTYAKRNIDSNYLVMESNGKLHHYAICISYSDTIVLHTPALRKDRQKLIELFKTIFLIYPITINKETEFTLAGPFTHKLGVYRNNKYFEYEVYEYSDTKEMINRHEKLMELQEIIDYKQYIKAPDIEEIKKLDTVYVHYTHAKMQKIEIPGNNHKYPSSYMFYHMESAYELFFELRNKPREEVLINVKRSFIRKHKNEIVDYTFFTKNRWEASFLRKKVVYIIDDDGKDIFLKKVKYSPVYFFID
ncbi:hypothetical protein [Flavobacterium psychrotrophum]|uniref:hypothetical protein n=1 Tax=Flavobacterium psychrotrophum TaxID=2294119 RepID=UPI000E3150C5|nr:hypothetical protein [Flavobacterium psychrotrophum]